jgi:hypothetical protein
MSNNQRVLAKENNENENKPIVISNDLYFKS